MLLVCGGEQDPNIQRFLEVGSTLGECKPILIGKDVTPELIWDLQKNTLRIDGELIAPSAAFLRADVFGGFEDPRPEVGFRAYGWHTTLDGFVRASPSVRIFNRHHDASFSKPVQLVAAKKFGLSIPSTTITNSELTLRSRQDAAIVKPVNGGDYCQDLSEVVERTRFIHGRAAAPAIVQTRMREPDLRIFRVGSDFMSFTLKSDALDYRTCSDVKVNASRNPSDVLLRRLEQLTDAAGLNFAAADFKRAPDSQDWVFLEVNSGPMFSAFDMAAKGRLVSLMLRHLTG